jgi:hypothetical protein
MEKTQFQIEFNWVLDVLISCKTLDQVQVSNNLYAKLITKWLPNLSESRIKTISTLYNKVKKFQITKIKKNRSQNNTSVDFFNS